MATKKKPAGPASKPETASAVEQPELEVRKSADLERPAGGVARSAATAASPLDAFGADVTDELAQAVPSFGEVLLSVGSGVAASQAALDKGVVDTAKTLSETKIEVVTEVIQELDEDGLPDPDSTQLVSRELSVLNFLNPTVHEWEDVRLSMDLAVGEIDSETGITFNRVQTQTDFSGGHWGFAGWFDLDFSATHTYASSEREVEADWARGQVRLDANLAPRETRAFPVPAEVTIGPQIYFSQGSTTDVSTASGDERQVELRIRVLKASGDSNPAKIVEIDTGNLVPEFIDDGTFYGQTTNNDGEIKVLLKRPVFGGASLRSRRTTVRASLGDISKTTTVVI